MISALSQFQNSFTCIAYSNITSIALYSDLGRMQQITNELIVNGNDDSNNQIEAITLQIKIKCFGYVNDAYRYGHLTHQMGDSLPFLSISYPFSAPFNSINIQQSMKRLSVGRTRDKKQSIQCFINSSNKVYCWYGPSSDASLNAVESHDEVEAIEFGVEHYCILWASPNQKVTCSLIPDSVKDLFSSIGIEIPFNEDPINAKIVDIQSGENKVCAIISNGKMKCVDVIVNHSILFFKSLADVRITSLISQKIVDFSIGNNHICAVIETTESNNMKSKGIKCFGSNNFGQLGLGDNIDRYMPTSESSFIDFGEKINEIKSIKSGYGHNCIIIASASSKDKSGLKCWGSNSFGEIGAEREKDDNLGDNPDEMNHLIFVNLGTNKKALQVNCGYFYTCVIIERSYELICFGRNSDGNLGLGDIEPRGIGRDSMGNNLLQTFLETPKVQVFDPLKDTRENGVVGGNDPQIVKIVAGGSSHTCALFDNHKVKCWGLNRYGEIGNGRLNDHVGDAAYEMGTYLPYITFANLDENIIDIAAGGYDQGNPNIDIDDCSGENFQGGHTCFLFQSGRVICIGNNKCGQLGLGDGKLRTNKNSTYTNLGVDSRGNPIKVISLAIGMQHSCVLIGNNVNIKRVKCFGGNRFQQLGLGIYPTGDKLSIGDEIEEVGDNLPYLDLGNELSVLSLFAGMFHNCAIFEGSFKMKCWGYNRFGQLGLGDYSFGHYDSIRFDSFPVGDNLPFVALGSNVDQVIDIALGMTFTCALVKVVGLSDATNIKCWGDSEISGFDTTVMMNQFLGDNPNEMGDNLPLVPFSSDTSFDKLSAGAFHICAKTKDENNVYCWGVNDDGQLGYTDTDYRYGHDASSLTPLIVNKGFKDLKVIDIAAGQGHTCILLSHEDFENVLKCFGWNYYGELGLGDSTNRLVSGVDTMDIEPTLVQSFTHIPKGWMEISKNAITSIRFPGIALKGGIPSIIGSLKNLQYLDLSQNMLTYVPKEISNLMKLEDVKLGFNNYHCDCQLFSTVEKLARSLQVFPILRDWDDVKCGNYNSYSGLIISSYQSSIQAPCFEPVDVMIQNVSSSGIDVTWKYDWKYDANINSRFPGFYIKCLSSKGDIIIDDLSDWQHQDINFHRISDQLTPLTNYSCEVVPFYEWYDEVFDVAKRYFGEEYTEQDILLTLSSPKLVDWFLSNTPFSMKIKTVQPKKKSIDGPRSLPFSFQTLPAPPKYPPTNIRVARMISNRQISNRWSLTLEWDDPSSSTSPPLSYKLEVKRVESTSSKYAFDCQERIITIGDKGFIKPATKYSVRIGSFAPSLDFNTIVFSDWVEVITDPSCKEGYYEDIADGIDVCIPCREGTYWSGLNSKNECTKCPNDRPITISAASLSINDCLTQPEFYFDTALAMTLPCPEGADCNRVGATVETIIIKPGYWRSSNFTSHVMKCPHPSFCVGDEESNMNEGGFCKVHHNGFLCESCDQGYAMMDNTNGCTICTNDNIISESVAFVFVICVLPFVFSSLSLFLFELVTLYLDNDLGNYSAWETQTASETSSSTSSSLFTQSIFDDPKILIYASRSVAQLLKIIQVFWILFTALYPLEYFTYLGESLIIFFSLCSFDITAVIRFPCIASAHFENQEHYLKLVIHTLWIIVSLASYRVSVRIVGWILRGRRLNQSLQRFQMHIRGKRRSSDVDIESLQSTTNGNKNGLKHHESIASTGHTLSSFTHLDFGSQLLAREFLLFTYPISIAIYLRTFFCINYQPSMTENFSLHFLSTSYQTQCFNELHVPWMIAVGVVVTLYTFGIPFYTHWKFECKPSSSNPCRKIAIYRLPNYSLAKGTFWFSIEQLGFFVTVSSLIPLILILSQNTLTGTIVRNYILYINSGLVLIHVLISNWISPFASKLEHLINLICLSILLFTFTSLILFS